MKNKQIEEEYITDSILIRNLIKKSFTSDELTIFCFDYFPEVYEIWDKDSGILIKAQFILEYCQKKGLIPYLINLIKTKNPYQHRIFIDNKKHLDMKLNRISPDCQNDYSSIVIQIMGTNSIDTKTKQENFGRLCKEILADSLKISPDDITILDIKEGSIILVLWIPSKVKKDLEILFFENKDFKKDFGNYSIDIFELPQEPSSLYIDYINKYNNELLFTREEYDVVLQSRNHSKKVILKRCFINNKDSFEILDNIVEIMKDNIENKTARKLSLSTEEISEINNVINKINSEQEQIKPWPWPSRIRERVRR